MASYSGQSTSPSDQSRSSSVEGKSLVCESSSPSVEGKSLVCESSSPSVEAKSLTDESNSPSVEVKSLTGESGSSSVEAKSPTGESSSSSVEERSPTGQGSSSSTQCRSPSAQGSSPRAHGSSPRAHGRSPIAHGSSPSAHGRSPSAHGRSPSAQGGSPSAQGISSMIVSWSSGWESTSSQVEYKDTERCSYQMRCMNQYRQIRKYTDFIFVVVDTVFHIHRIVFGTLSDRCRDIVESNYQPNFRMNINVNQVKPGSFGAILDYAYTGSVSIASWNVYGILSSAIYLQIPYLQMQCQNFIILDLKDENVCIAVEFSCQYSIAGLKEAAVLYFTKNLTTVIKYNSFKTIEARFLIEIFENDNILIGRRSTFSSFDVEERLLEAIFIYISKVSLYDDILQRLLNTVRLPFIEDDMMHQISQKYASLISNNEIIQTFLALHPLSRTTQMDSSVSDVTIPDTWQRDRASYCEFFTSIKRYGLPSQKMLPPPQGLDTVDHDMEIESVSIWARSGHSIQPRLIVGICVNYRTTAPGVFNYNYRRGSDFPDWVCKTLTLEPGEGIVELNIWTPESCEHIAGMNFVTSTNRQFGPCGSVYGRKYTARAPYDKRCCLYAILCDSEPVMGATAITNMVLKWIKI